MGIRHFSISPELLGAIALALIVGVIDNGHKYWYYAQHEIR